MNLPKKNTQQAKTHNSTEPSKSLKPRIEVSAGGIVYKRTKHGVLVGMIMDAYGKWTFPKGHVRRGESLQEAAQRECFEEMGLTRLRPVRKLGRIDIWFVDRFVHKGRLIHKFIYYFLFEASHEARVRKPAISAEGERITQVAWVPFEQMMERSTYKDLDAVLKAAVVHIQPVGGRGKLGAYESNFAQGGQSTRKGRGRDRGVGRVRA